MKTALISYLNNHLVTSDLATREGQSSTTPRSDLADRVALISLPQLPSLPDVPIAITNSAVENFVHEFHNAGYVSEPLRPLHGVLVGYQGHRADLNGRLMRAVRWVPPHVEGRLGLIMSWLVIGGRYDDGDGYEVLNVLDENIDFGNQRAITVDVENGWNSSDRIEFSEERERHYFLPRKIYAQYLQPDAERPPSTS